ncbi:MAG: hypothetical protein H6858_09205 [Rhodospirillales bacterium]|nr:hypothetical protein [Alphaproteobacteria bacterium]MCB9977761.1 hypothetical protein [Rhodospirillales bacterium]
MTATEYLTRTLGRLRRAWSGTPATFLGRPLSDPQAIADDLVEQDADEEQVRQFIRLAIGRSDVKKVDMIIALRTLMEHGSEVATISRNTGYAMAMGDIHDQVEDYLLAAIEYSIAYLHKQDSGFYHMASEIETRNRPRDAQGYMDAVYWLANMPDDPAEAINSLPDDKITGYYPPKYYEELAQALQEHPEIKQALNADFLVYRAATAVNHGLDRNRAWSMHMDGLRSSPTEHVLDNPFVRQAFDRTLAEQDYEG